MANSQQAKKRARQNITRFELKKSQKTALRTQIKKFLSLIENKQLDEAKESYKLTVKSLSKLAKKNVLHSGKASRLTSRLNAKLKQLALAK